MGQGAGLSESRNDLLGIGRFCSHELNRLGKLAGSCNSLISC